LSSAFSLTPLPFGCPCRNVALLCMVTIIFTLPHNTTVGTVVVVAVAVSYRTLAETVAHLNTNARSCTRIRTQAHAHNSYPCLFVNAFLAAVSQPSNEVAIQFTFLKEITSCLILLSFLAPSLFSLTIGVKFTI
jgi:hypothetical protein